VVRQTHAMRLHGMAWAVVKVADLLILNIYRSRSRGRETVQ
jgi:hypothetical protein